MLENKQKLKQLKYMPLKISMKENMNITNLTKKKLRIIKLENNTGNYI